MALTVHLTGRFIYHPSTDLVLVNISARRVVSLLYCSVGPSPISRSAFLLMCFVVCVDRSITQSYYRNSVGVVLVFDICQRASFEHIPTWMMEARRSIEPRAPTFVLVGSKADQERRREVRVELMFSIAHIEFCVYDCVII